MENYVQITCPTGVANFNAKDGCLKCTVEGEYSYISRTVVFPSHNAPPRTDENFRKETYGAHHKTRTPLIDIPNLDMIQDIVVADSMHLIELGSMKRLLKGWTDGSLGFTTKLSFFEISAISEKLLRINLPSEMHRRMRGLDSLAFWKAVEFANFLRYVGIVVLKDHLTEDAYEHFRILFCAITILSTNAHQLYWSVARKMLLSFVEDYASLYGTHYITSNVHNLVHIVDEVERLGPLPTLAAYPFENTLFRIKNYLRNGNKNVQQAANRLSELSRYESSVRLKAVEFPYTKFLKNGTIECGVKEGFVLSTKHKNSWFMSKRLEIVKFEGVGRNKIIQGRCVIQKNDFFNLPFASSTLNIFEAATIQNNFSEVSEYKLDNILCKLVAIPANHNTVFLPLLHTLEE